MPEILKLSQGHQTYHENVDPKQGYKHAQFERSCLNSVWEKATFKFFSSKEVCQLSPLNMCANLK